MILDETIKYAEEVAEEKEKYIKRIYETLPAEERFLFAEEENECKKCAKEHRQLAEWLKELKQLKEKEPCQDIKEYYKDIWDCDINHPLYEDTVAEIVEKSYISGYAHGVKNTAKEFRFELEQGSCEDAISRKAAQAKIKSICDEYRLSYEDGERKAATGGSAYALGHAFDDLPPVTPQPKMGRWILADEQNKEDVENDNYRFICSECQCSDIHAKDTIVPYCWKCGTRMVESED